MTSLFPLEQNVPLKDFVSGLYRLFVSLSVDKDDPQGAVTAVL